MGGKLEAFRIFSENYAKPLFSNPKVSTALLVIALGLGGWDVWEYLNGGKSAPETVEVNVEAPRPVFRGPDLGPIEGRLATLEARDSAKEKRIRILEKIHE